MASEAIKHLTGARVVGLGSGSTVAHIVREMARIKDKSSLKCIPTSTQIKIEAEKSGLVLADESHIPEIDVVFDGADQIDQRFNMIKGGGGALLREKILISAAKKVVIVADESKFVNTLSRAVPIEVHPFARSLFPVELKRHFKDASPSLRVLEKGYPFLTENGNFVFDTSFGEIQEPSDLEQRAKSLPGVLEVGIFSRTPDLFLRLGMAGQLDVISTR